MMMTLAQSSVLVVILAQFVTVSSLACTSSTGITYEDCLSGGALPGVGTGGATPVSYKMIGSCADEVFNGINRRQGYEYSGYSDTDYDITITAINLSAGEELEIKTFKCNPGNVCKKAVIGPAASVPITITMNKENFVFYSKSDTLSVTFHVEDGCTPSFCSPNHCLFLDRKSKPDAAAFCQAQGEKLSEPGTYDDFLEVAGLAETHRAAMGGYNAWLGLKNPSDNPDVYTYDLNGVDTLIDSRIPIDSTYTGTQVDVSLQYEGFWELEDLYGSSVLNFFCTNSA